MLGKMIFEDLSQAHRKKETSDLAVTRPDRLIFFSGLQTYSFFSPKPKIPWFFEIYFSTARNGRVCVALYRCEEPAAGRQSAGAFGKHGVHPGSGPEP